MSDVFSKDDRSLIMSKISSKDTKPEILVRRILHKMGFRYRLHVDELPGTPDIVLHRHKKIIFVHGCFWHGHKGCNRSKRPKTNVDFWNQKIDKNIARDGKIKDQLEQMGWSVLVIWQCQTRDSNLIQKIILDFMSNP